MNYFGFFSEDWLFLVVQIAYDRKSPYGTSGWALMGFESWWNKRRHMGSWGMGKGVIFLPQSHLQDQAKTTDWSNDFIASNWSVWSRYGVGLESVWSWFGVGLKSDWSPFKVRLKPVWSQNRVGMESVWSRFEVRIESVCWSDLGI